VVQESDNCWMVMLAVERVRVESLESPCSVTG
jgi:hypothetical protein